MPRKVLNNTSESERRRKSSRGFFHLSLRQLLTLLLLASTLLAVYVACLLPAAEYVGGQLGVLAATWSVSPGQSAVDRKIAPSA